jgi:sec-independent protein translocase protein TatA
MLSFWELIIVVVVIVMIFGTRRFGRAIRSLGTGGREFKRAITEDEDEALPPNELPPPTQPS